MLIQPNLNFYKHLTTTALKIIAKSLNLTSLSHLLLKLLFKKQKALEEVEELNSIGDTLTQLLTSIKYLLGVAKK
jgi:hypothetical protein